MKNVCDTPECNSSQKKTVSYNSTSRVYLLSGEVKSIKPNFRNEVTTIKIEDSSLSSYTIRA
ncbi:MAG: hypothetical protein LBF15_04765 [Candidatus Peribacteria bacterium]|nr:hypothetical protein [Candidatus Peribacteria bacterium]